MHIYYFATCNSSDACQTTFVILYLLFFKQIIALDSLNINYIKYPFHVSTFLFMRGEKTFDHTGVTRYIY